MKNLYKLVFAALAVTFFAPFCQAQDTDFELGYSCVGFHRMKVDEDAQKYRIASFRIYNDFDAVPPSSIRSSSSSLIIRFLTRQVDTKQQDVKQNIWRSMATGSLVLLIPIIFFFLLYILLAFFGQLEPKKFLLPAFFFLAIFFLSIYGLAYYSGSYFCIDNATDKTLEVRIDRKFSTEMHPKSFFERRISGNTVKIEVLHNGVTVETADIKLDKNFGQNLLRLFFGRGTIIYNIGAANKYYVREVEYGK